MARLNPAIVNVLIGIVIGLCIAFLFLPSNFSNSGYSIRTPLGRDLHSDHRHDAHTDEEVDDSNAPKQAMHFHGGNDTLHHGGIYFKLKLF